MDSFKNAACVLLWMITLPAVIVGFIFAIASVFFEDGYKNGLRFGVWIHRRKQ